MRYCLYLIVLLLGISAQAQQSNTYYTDNPIAREHIRLAESYIEQGKPDKAIKELDRCIKYVPVTYAYWLRGSSLYNQGKWKKSIKDLTVVVKDTVGIPADLQISAKAMLAQAEEKKIEQSAKRISMFGIYGTTYALLKSTATVTKVIKESAPAIVQAKLKAEAADSTAVAVSDSLPENNPKNQ